VSDGSPGCDAVAGLIRKLRVRDRLTNEEVKVLAGMVADVSDFPAGTLLVRAGVPLDRCTLLVDGMACRYKGLETGQRQILELHVPGDFVDLHSFVLKRLEHDIASLTPVRMAFVPHARMKEVTERHPHLARMLWFSTLLDAAINREWILSMGRRSAIARIAHIFCELKVRLELAGLCVDGRYALPLTQIDLADASGLTPVHVNRMLRKLRDDGLLTFRGGDVVIHDPEGLERIAEFKPGYLFLERRPG
jgi:CRP-like cAMP-binding protein